MKNIQKGFVSPLLTMIITLLVLVGANINKNSVDFLNINTPKVVDNVLAPKDNTIIDNDLWIVFDKVSEALKNKDATAYNAVSYTQVTPDQATQFSQMATFLYEENIKVNKTNFINKWQDDKQAIYSTNPVKADDADSYGYTKGIISFVKKDGSWKILTVNLSKNWSVLKAGNNKTPAQIEQDLQGMMLDFDKDGLTDNEEKCSGAQQYNPNCVKSDSNKRDTNGNGWWDGIDTDMN